jgi:integrase
MAVFPHEYIIDPNPTKSGAPLIRGACPECNAHVLKLGSEADLAVLRRGPNPNTSEDLAHEEKRVGPAGIGISDDSLGSANDRLVLNWQTYAGRYSEKTIDRHLESIRFFEKIIDQKPFERLTQADVEKCRATLKRALVTDDAEHALSKSTVQHRASHIRAFLEWLIKQDGFKRLPNDLPEYIALPKAAYAASIPTKPLPYPTVDEARDMLLDMPKETLRQQRNRAMFALAFLGALRADTLTSLWFGDFDVERRLIIQDARHSRTKNGKSLNIVWFPIPLEFEETVKDWCKILKDAGFEADDALFPEASRLEHGLKYSKTKGGQVPTMRSSHAITQAFKAASVNCEQSYTPHSAKHAIAHERGTRSLTDEQRRAWSLNMGHENEQITEKHYAKMSDERRFDVLESITDDAARGQTDLIAEKIVEEIRDDLREILSKRMGTLNKPL